MLWFLVGIACVFCGVAFLSYSFLLILMLVELSLVFFFSYFSYSFAVGASYSILFLMLFIGLMVLEAVVGLSVVLISYRSYGGSYFLLW